jgi:hypothetical protein
MVGGGGYILKEGWKLEVDVQSGGGGGGDGDLDLVDGLVSIKIIGIFFILHVEFIYLAPSINPPAFIPPFALRPSPR